MLCELDWVLRSREKQPRAAIADAIAFADYLMREHALAAGAIEVVTFDRALKGEPGFKIIG